MGHGSRGVRLGPGADALGMGRRARRSVDLLRPAAADGTSSTFHADDFTVALRVAVWSTAATAPDGAAATCSSSRGTLGSASYGMQGEWLGVSYFVEGVFSGGAAGQLVQLEVIAPEQKRAFAHALLAAWLRRNTE